MSTQRLLMPNTFDGAKGLAVGIVRDYSFGYENGSETLFLRFGPDTRDAVVDVLASRRSNTDFEHSDFFTPEPWVGSGVAVEELCLGCYGSQVCPVHCAVATANGRFTSKLYVNGEGAAALISALSRGGGSIACSEPPEDWPFEPECEYLPVSRVVVVG